MINKVVKSLSEAVSKIGNGAVVYMGGFGDAGSPDELADSLANRGVRDLTIISNNAGHGTHGLAHLISEQCVKRLICSFPTSPRSIVFKEALARGQIELELVPQGTLVERIRAAGSGLGGVLTPTGIGTEFENGKDTYLVNGKAYLIETALPADFALIKASQADRWGNLIYRLSSRNFNVVMAMGARATIAQTQRVVDDFLPADAIHTPGIFVSQVVETPPIKVS